MNRSAKVMSLTLEKERNEVDVIPYWQRHQMSMAASLETRLAKAKAKQDLQLVAQLQQEQKVVRTFMLSALSCELPQRSFTQAIFDLCGKLQKYLLDRKLPYIKKTTRATGEILWQGCDPKTGAKYCCETEAEIVDWLETITYQPPTHSPYRLWGGAQAYRQLSRSSN